MRSGTHPVRWHRTVVGLVLAVAQPGTGIGRQAAGPGPAILPCPTGGRLLPAGAALQPAVDLAAPGTVLCLSAGEYAGPVEIHTRLTLRGPPDAVIRSMGSGTTVRVVADSVALIGFTVDGSGRRYDRMDGGVYLHGDGIIIRRLTLRDALFGIVAEQSNGVTIAENHITGLAALPVGIRGDGIRLWEVRGSLVEGNRLEHSRDILVWYSPGNRIVRNTVAHSRYGTHFMYSDDCLVQGAEYRSNIVGVFVMYSRGVTLQGNTITDNAGVDGMGLGVKESGNLVVADNRFIHDQACVYLDTSPFREGDSVFARGNLFARCSAGVTFHSSERHNMFYDNAFQDNQAQVVVEGRGTAQGVQWRKNYFDDYQGYDLDDDGIGDVPYELRDLPEQLVAQHPQLAFLRGTVAFALLDVAARAVPLLQPETVLVDPRPRMATPLTH